MNSEDRIFCVNCGVEISPFYRDLGDSDCSPLWVHEDTSQRPCSSKFVVDSYGNGSWLPGEYGTKASPKFDSVIKTDSELYEEAQQKALELISSAERGGILSYEETLEEIKRLILFELVTIRQLYKPQF